MKWGVLRVVEKWHSLPMRHHSKDTGAMGKGDGKGEESDSLVVMSDMVGLFMIGRHFLD